jgi:hypothetical protein
MKDFLKVQTVEERSMSISRQPTKAEDLEIINRTTQR